MSGESVTLSRTVVFLIFLTLGELAFPQTPEKASENFCSKETVRKWKEDVKKGADRALTATLLGYVYEGFLACEGIPKDYAQAAEWYVQAVKDGSTEAMWHLALMLHSGAGKVKQDHTVEVRLLRMAADRGDLVAMLTLSDRYANGSCGVEKNRLMAYALTDARVREQRCKISNATTDYYKQQEQKRLEVFMDDRSQARMGLNDSDLDNAGKLTVRIQSELAERSLSSCGSADKGVR